MSSQIPTWINTIAVNFGIPVDTAAWLVLFPLVATLVAFLRQVVGLKAFGIYTPSIIILVFLTIGLKYGLAIYLAVITVGMGTRFLLRRLRILYLPRMAITVTVVSLVMLGILIIGGWLGRTGFAAVSPLPLLILVILVEKFVAVQIEKGTRGAILLAGETLLVSLLGYALFNYDSLVYAFLNSPWLILLVIPFNILIGKWSGLRLTEYFRFREVLKKMK